MMRIRPLLLAGTLLFSTVAAAQARPHRRHHAAAAAHRRVAERHARVRHRRGGSAHEVKLAENPADIAKLLRAGDPQTLVLTGRLRPFFDPNDLSKPPVLDAPAAILLDADTGQILWGKNANERRFPASTTKILTALLFIEHTQPSQVVTCLDPSLVNIEESSLHIQPWEKFTAQDLLYGTLLRSANDGAVLMAETVAGSVPKFAEMMNARARQLGATDSNFVTPNGLPDPNHYTTAHDLALIARAAMQNPRFEDAVGTPDRFIQRSVLVRDSHIVAKAKPEFYDRFPGADGVKTGYTRAAGHCFVGSATRDGRRLLSVVLGARSSATRDTIPLLEWGFRRFPAVVLARRGQIEGQVPVSFGADGAVPVAVATELHATTDSLAPPPGQIRTEIEPLPGLQAPIRRGQEVGKLVAKIGDKLVGEAPLIAERDDPRATLSAALVHGGGFGAGALRVAEWVCGAAALLLIGFRYAAAIAARGFAGVIAPAAPAKGARRRRRRVAAASRGDYRIR